MSTPEQERPLTLRQAVSDKRGLSDAYRASVIELLEELELADTIILHDSVGLAKPIALIYPADGGILSPALEATNDVTYAQQKKLIDQQDAHIRALAEYNRQVSRLLETYLTATVLTPVDAELVTAGGDDGPST